MTDFLVPEEREPGSFSPERSFMQAEVQGLDKSTHSLLFPRWSRKGSGALNQREGGKDKILSSLARLPGLLLEATGW